MKTVALSVLSVALAAIVYLLLQALMWVTIGFLSLIVLRPSVHATELLILYASAFLTGLILTRVKPFFRPLVTVPLGTMAMWVLWGQLVFIEDGPFGLSRGWIALGGFLASVALVSLAGCAVATRTSRRLAKSSVSWFHAVGPLVVLACSSAVASLLGIALSSAQLAPDFRRALTFGLLAVAVIAVVTIAHAARIVAQAARTAAVRQSG